MTPEEALAQTNTDLSKTVAVARTLGRSEFAVVILQVIATAKSNRASLFGTLNVIEDLCNREFTKQAHEQHSPSA